MTRRTGQKGSLVRKGDCWHVRFWMDVPGQEKRARKSVPVCPVSGPGAMTKSERQRRASEIIRESGADTPECLERSNASLGVTFRRQAEWWLDHVQKRKRRPVRGATLESWRYPLDRWILPAFGDHPVGMVDNPQLKELVSTLTAAGLKPKSVQNYAGVLKLVVASAIDEFGRQLYPRNWNLDFCDMPVVKNQRRPVVSSAELEKILDELTGDCRAVVQILCGTAIRIGEMVGLRVENIVDDCTTIRVHKSAWKRQLQDTKTDNGFREVDLHPDLARLVRAVVNGRTEGFLFQTKTGRPICSHNMLNRHLNPVLEKLGLGKKGWHAFRRFRRTHLGQQGTPDSLMRYWMGHAEREVGQIYDRSREDVKFRKQWAERVGLGFTVRETESQKKGLVWTQLDPKPAVAEGPETIAA